MTRMGLATLLAERADIGLDEAYRLVDTVPIEAYVLGEIPEDSVETWIFWLMEDAGVPGETEKDRACDRGWAEALNIDAPRDI